MIEIIKLKKIYNKKIVLRIDYLKIIEGHICGFFGLNGAGKSTLMKIICSLSSPDEGDILINNTKYIKKTSHIKIGFMIENPVFFDNISGIDNLKLLAKLYDGIDQNRINEIVDMVGLKNQAEKLYKKYSLGMKQRLYFAYSLIDKPNILILDEPFNGIDPVTISIFKKIILVLKNKGVTVLISSHGINDIQDLCDDAIIIDKGEIIYQTENAKSEKLLDIFLEKVSSDGDAQ